jgi:hypothetical protein
LLKALIVEVLSAKKQEVQDTLDFLQQNSVANAKKIKQYIANLERYNFPMEGPASGSLMFPTPLYRADSAALMNTDNEQTRNIATSILALKKQKAIKRKIKIKANVAAFADLVVDNPERLEDLLDELLRNSGSLIAQLILNRDNSGARQTARNIVVDFINRNIERIAGSAAMATPAETEPIIEIPVLPSAAPAFDPARRLYLSASLPANTRQELESALRDYLNNLEQPLYVFVNYSHDANTENYLSRAIGNKPKGIPEGARYKVYTIINTPGSIMENVVGEAGEVTATTTKGGIVEGVMREDEAVVSLCNWWYQNITSSLFPSQSDDILEERLPLFEYVAENFNTYTELSKSANQNIIGHGNWSARKSSFSLDRNNLTLIEKFVNKLLKETTPSFTLAQNGIFLSEYKVEGKIYKLALYSENANVNIEKITVDDLCDLVDHEVVKIVLKNDYILISFFKEKKLQITLQIFAHDDKDAELWLKYLGIFIKGPTILDQVKAYWDGLWSEEPKKQEELNDVSVVENVTFHGYSSNDKAGCFRRSREMLESSGYTTVEPSDTSVVQMTKYNEDGVLTIQENIEKGKILIDNHLNSGRPIIVGVDWKPGHTGNYDQTTDHWIILVARIIQGNLTCYRYFDPQTGQEEVGTSEANKLCVQSDGTIKGRYREGSDYDREYTITMVRPSKNK